MYNLSTTILSLPNIIGCEEFPRSEHGKLLVEDIGNFINNNYKMSGAEIVKAFDMAATHSLYLDGKRVDPSTFGKFLSRSSVGKILTAYKESKQSKNARPSNYNYRQLPEAPFKPISNAEAWEIVLKFAIQDGQPPFAAPYLGAYEYLVENKQINPVRKASNKSMFANFESAERTAVEKYLITNTLKSRQ